MLQYHIMNGKIIIKGQLMKLRYASENVNFNYLLLLENVI